MKINRSLFPSVTRYQLCKRHATTCWWFSGFSLNRKTTLLPGTKSKPRATRFHMTHTPCNTPKIRRSFWAAWVLLILFHIITMLGYFLTHEFDHRPLRDNLNPLAPLGEVQGGLWEVQIPLQSAQVSWGWSCHCSLRQSWKTGPRCKLNLLSPFVFSLHFF